MTPENGGDPPDTRLTHPELVDFFFEWRDFQTPEMMDGIPDYTETAMAKQQIDLIKWREQLNVFDTAGWPVKHQIDWYLVWAEMNGLDFAHRVKKPWSRSPAFYVWYYPSPTDVPEREGPNIHGAIELPNYNWPVPSDDAAELAERLRAASGVFEQARTNLTGSAEDLWVTGTRSIREQSEDLQRLSDSIRDICK